MMAIMKNMMIMVIRKRKGTMETKVIMKTRGIIEIKNIRENMATIMVGISRHHWIAANMETKVIMQTKKVIENKANMEIREIMEI